jgi:hypothetical protein
MVAFNINIINMCQNAFLQLDQVLADESWWLCLCVDSHCVCSWWQKVGLGFLAMQQRASSHWPAGQGFLNIRHENIGGTSCRYCMEVTMNHVVLSQRGYIVVTEVLKMFAPMLLYGFHNRHQTNTEWMIYKHHSQCSVLPQIFGIFWTFLTTGSV